jgi:hypothetical protein
MLTRKLIWRPTRMTDCAHDHCHAGLFAEINPNDHSRCLHSQPIIGKPLADLNVKLVHICHSASQNLNHGNSVLANQKVAAK